MPLVSPVPVGKMRPGRLRVLTVVVLCICLLVGVATPAQQMATSEIPGNSQYTTFEAPRAGTGSTQGTQAFSINSDGYIAGAYIDASNVVHGFVRASNGKMTEFDAPGAGTGEYPNGTTSESI